MSTDEQAARARARDALTGAGVSFRCSDDYALALDRITSLLLDHARERDEAKSELALADEEIAALNTRLRSETEETRHQRREWDELISERDAALRDLEEWTSVARNRGAKLLEARADLDAARARLDDAGRLLREQAMTLRQLCKAVEYEGLITCGGQQEEHETDECDGDGPEDAAHIVWEAAGRGWEVVEATRAFLAGDTPPAPVQARIAVGIDPATDPPTIVAFPPAPASVQAETCSRCNHPWGEHAPGHGCTRRMEGDGSECECETR